jgi:hypothetical protein
MKKGYIVKCNDSIKCIVDGDFVKANNIKEQMQAEAYEHDIMNYADFDHYCSIFFWNVKELPVL